jgi:hypothetical protein
MTNWASDTCPFYLITYSITLVLAFTGICSGLCTFYLIWRLKLSNYYVSIIKWLTACTLIYDFGFFLVPQCTDMLGGISTTLWVNLICFEVIDFILRSILTACHNHKKTCPPVRYILSSPSI